MTEQERLVLEFAQSQRRNRVGDGECWTLAERALQSAGANTSSDLQNVSRTVNYVWGTAVTIATAQPGDIVQFRDGFTNTRTVTYPDGSSRFETIRIRRHHTGIVEQVITNGKVIRIIGQNLPVGSSVESRDFYFHNVSFAEGNNQVTVTVSGRAEFYRPQPRTAARRSRR